MEKTKIKKIIAHLGIVAIIAGSLNNTFAATTIGQGSVTGDATFDSDIIWDDSFPGTATGSVSGIKVKARVLPTISMVISDKQIDLGNLNADIESTGNLDIEIGTNAANGVIVTAKSGSGGLINKSNDTIEINNLAADGVSESYTYSSTVGAHDSSITGFTQSSDLLATEINDNTTEHVIYSTNKPEQSDGTNVDVKFNVGVTANAQTPAGDYEDLITFTITGNF